MDGDELQERDIRIVEEQTAYVRALRAEEYKNRAPAENCVALIVDASGGCLLLELALIVERYAPYVQRPVVFNWMQEPQRFSCNGSLSRTPPHRLLYANEPSASVKVVDDRKSGDERRLREIKLPFTVIALHSTLLYDSIEDAPVLSCTNRTFYCWLSETKGCYRVLQLPAGYVFIGVGGGGIFARDAGNQLIHITTLAPERFVVCSDLRCQPTVFEVPKEDVMTGIQFAPPSFGVVSWEGAFTEEFHANVSASTNFDSVHHSGYVYTTAVQLDKLAAYLRRCSPDTVRQHIAYYESIGLLPHGGALIGLPLPFLSTDAPSLSHYDESAHQCTQCLTFAAPAKVMDSSSLSFVNSESILPPDTQSGSLSVEINKQMLPSIDIVTRRGNWVVLSFPA